MAEPDREALYALAQDLRLGQNHLRDLLEWLEEIELRDGLSPREVLCREPLVQISSDPRLSRSDKLKRIKDEVRRLRFPRLSRMEEAIHSAIREMKLNPGIQVMVPPALEGGSVTVQLKSSSYEELKRMAVELERALESESARTLFSLLRGEAA